MRALILTAIHLVCLLLAACSDGRQDGRSATSTHIAPNDTGVSTSALETKSEAIPDSAGEASMRENTIKTDDQWRAALTPEQYRITRRKGTERAFTGEYYNTKTPGVYNCVCCNQPLFASEAKYNSGSGWPSFTRPIDEDHVASNEDRSLGMMRTEIMCSGCGSHLGHVFDNGPAPTGLRYCVNSASLKLEPAD